MKKDINKTKTVINWGFFEIGNREMMILILSKSTSPEAKLKQPTVAR